MEKNKRNLKMAIDLIKSLEDQGLPQHEVCAMLSLALSLMIANCVPIDETKAHENISNLFDGIKLKTIELHELMKEES